MNFMMIELDEIDSETLKIILNTLETYELYRLCLIICNKYKLNENAKYVAAISQKYSNMRQIKIDGFSTLRIKAKNEAQLKYSLIVNEAMHNVLNVSGFYQNPRS